MEKFLFLDWYSDDRWCVCVIYDKFMISYDVLSDNSLRVFLQTKVVAKVFFSIDALFTVSCLCNNGSSKFYADYNL